MSFDLLDTADLKLIADGYWLALAFILGAAVGSFVNVMVARLPVEKSLIWPSSRCGSCLQPIRWFDNIPLLSYVRLRGQCRACGQTFSSSYFWVELVTALGFAGLLYLEVIENVHGWPPSWGAAHGLYPWASFVGWAFHALLFTLLLTASVSDLRRREIPLQLTLTGTILGLVGATLLPWPWPWTPAIATPAGPTAWRLGPIGEGIYAWPFWGPLPAWAAPGDNWQTGLATGLAGALVGTFLLRGIGFLFGAGLGKDALGLGDADLMMMAGAFLGWQVVVVGFFASIFPALLFAIFQLVVNRDNSLPFGPALSLGVLATGVGWHTVVTNLPSVQMVLFWDVVVVLLVIASGGLLLGMAFVVRLLQR